MVFIYALVDPFTKSVRYIGKSIRPQERLRDHCNDPATTYRTNWIRSVVAKGKRPELLLLEELPDSADWQAAERRWIASGRKAGWSLTNCTDGGDGVPNLPPEIKARIARAWLGRKHTPRELEKMRAASLGRKHTEQHKAHMREIMTGRKITWVSKVARSLEKLSDVQVREIKLALSTGTNQYTLARQYGVHQGTISNIKRGVSYSHISI